MNEKSPPDPPTCLLPELCAEEVHKNILRCFRLGNRVTLKLLGWIKVLHDHNFAQTLSSRSTVQYIIDNLKYGQTEAYNLLNVALSIPGLPRTACAFEKGEISWSQVKPIAEIAKRGTEEAWISYARKNTVQALESKVKAALEEGEELPSDEEHGLPNIEVKMVFRLSRENQEIVRKALELSAAQLKESRRDGDTRVTHEEALVHLAKRGLKTDLFGPGSKASARERSIFDILFQVCPSCEESRMHTREGPVQVPREHVSQIEPEARKVEIGREELVKGEALTEGKIDGLEIPKDVQRKVLTRFGNACARCGRKLRLHLHHLIFRSKGGPNEVWNLIPTCATCHSLVHGQTLEVFLDSAGDLHWKSRGDRIELVLKEEFEELSSVAPAVIVVEKKEEAPERKVPGASEAEPHREPAAVGMSGESEGAAEAIEKIGYGKKEARELVLKAQKLLSGLGRAPTGDEILNTALRGRAVVLGASFRTSGNSGPKRGEEGEARRKAPPSPETS